MLPPEARLPELERLVERQEYFVLHAARQTGKSTAMRAFAARLRAQGTVALHASLETSQDAPEVAEAEPRWLEAIHRYAIHDLAEADRPPRPDLARAVGGERLADRLRAWCATSGKAGHGRKSSGPKTGSSKADGSTCGVRERRLRSCPLPPTGGRRDGDGVPRGGRC